MGGAAKLARGERDAAYRQLPRHPRHGHKRLHVVHTDEADVIIGADLHFRHSRPVTRFRRNEGGGAAGGPPPLRALPASQ
jgi:hypothetical protein